MEEKVVFIESIILNYSEMNIQVFHFFLSPAF